MRPLMLLVAFGAIAMSHAAHADDKGPVRVTFETEKGNIEVELYPDKAPITVANFLKYVDAKMYDDGRFHRAVTANNQPTSQIKIAVIQGKSAPGREKDLENPIKLERTRDTKLAHKDGTVSMARDGPDTAQDEFFICIGPQPELDFGGKRNADGQGFAAFGQVVKGMDVVKKIHESPTEGQFLKPAIKIMRTVKK
jgi:peptidyl-prolyl cis-trans isomerase A (cyclophilin A)